MNYFQGKKVCVTGGAGFVGSHFVDIFLDVGAHVFVPVHNKLPHRHHPHLKTAKADLECIGDSVKCIKGSDIVVHCAGGVANSITSPHAALSLITRYLSMAANVVEAAARNGVERVLLFSSSTGYPKKRRCVIENDFWSGEPDPRYFGYGWMRRYIERLSEYATSSSDTQFRVVRPTALYGPRSKFNIRHGQVISSLIEQSLQTSDRLVVRGNGADQRDLMYITDFVEICIRFLGLDPYPGPTNIASGKSATIKKIAELVAKYTPGPSKVIEFTEPDHTEVFSRKVSNKKMRDLLKVSPTTTLENGIQKTIAWRISEVSNSVGIVSLH